MNRTELIQRVDEAYQLIETRIDSQKLFYESRNIRYKRISFEDISLEDVLESKLLPLLKPLMDYYAYLPLEQRRKSYRIYIGTLCEIVKNGLVNGGILLTMEARIGVFDRNHHYAILKSALYYEGINVIERHRKYEETIINEAGIPRGYHKKCIEFFQLYWKWLHNYDALEREEFLTKYLHSDPLDKVYIIDPNDRARMALLRQETNSFSEKVIKTCLKFDAVFTAIDSYPGTITINNIDSVSADISAKVGFDIFTVVKSSSVRQYILEYARKVSFLKFSRLMMSLPDNEEIILPNGKRRKNREYSFSHLIGGVHYIRGNAYEVSFPTSLALDDYYRQELQKPVLYGNAVIYTSDEPIMAEIDGIEHPCRTFYHSYYGLRYVFYERVAPASFVYLDGVPLDITDPFSQKSYICKYWDTETRHYRLALCIDSLKCVNASASMMGVSLLCNGTEIVRGQTNRNGAFRLTDKVIPLPDELPSETLILEISIGGHVSPEWTVEVLDFYIWAKQSGVRIRNEIDLSKWFGDTSVILFSKEPVKDSSFSIEYLYRDQGYYVYEGRFDRASEALYVAGTLFPIKAPTLSFIELLTDYEIIAGKICIGEHDKLSIKVHNFDCTNETQILLVEHNNTVRSYNLLQLLPEDLENVCALVPVDANSNMSNIGEWNFILFKDGHRINELSVVILPSITIQPTKKIYLEGETVSVEVRASANCFEQEGEYVNAKQITIGNAQIGMTGNLVHTISLEFDCYIDKCETPMHLSYSPNTWGIRMMELKENKWLDPCLKSMTVGELDQFGIFICSTANHELRIKAGDDITFRTIRPGYNKLSVKNLLWNYGSKTEIIISDCLSQEYVLSVICPTRISASKLDATQDALVTTITYNGPVNSTLEIRVFSGNKQILSLRRNIIHNSYVKAFYIDRHRITNPDISIEARVGSQDFQQILRETVDLEKIPIWKQRAKFSGSMSIVDLLSCFDDGRRASIPASLLGLLERGGFE